MNKTENNTMLAMIFVQLFVFGLLIFFDCYFHLFQMKPEYIVNVSIDGVIILLCACLYYSCAVNKNHTKSEKYFLTLVLFETFTVFTDAMCWLLQGRPEFSGWNEFFNVLFYSCAVIQPLLSWHYQTNVMNLFSKNERRISVCIDLFALAALIIIFLNHFFGYYYSVDYITGIYSRGKFCALSNIYPLFVCFCSIFFIITKKSPWQVRISLLIIFLCPYIAMIVQLCLFGLSFTYVAVFIALFLMYMNIHVGLTNEYSEIQKKNLEQEAELAELQNRIMISQIQPHFMYNTLTTIHALCSINPEKAAEVTEKFAKYLRGNISSLESQTPIPFDTELNHTKIYSDIEIERFDNIRVIYDIKFRDFSIPALSIQPLVENAIRHGIRGKDDGFVKITSERILDCAVITVKDNGKGFIPGQTSGNGPHIGLSNITERVKTMVNGTVRIDSVLNQGTTVTVTIPLGEKE